jgi:hypothetical protein
MQIVEPNALPKLEQCLHLGFGGSLHLEVRVRNAFHFPASSAKKQRELAAVLGRRSRGSVIGSISDRNHHLKMKG